MNRTASALYHVLRLRPASDHHPDGTDVFVEAFTENTQGVRDCVKQMLGDLHSGNPDDAALGRQVRQMVEHYAMTCPDFNEALEREDEETMRLRRMVGAL